MTEPSELISLGDQVSSDAYKVLFYQCRSQIGLAVGKRLEDIVMFLY